MVAYISFLLGACEHRGGGWGARQSVFFSPQRFIGPTRLSPQRFPKKTKMCHTRLIGLGAGAGTRAVVGAGARATCVVLCCIYYK